MRHIQLMHKELGMPNGGKSDCLFQMSIPNDEEWEWTNGPMKISTQCAGMLPDKIKWITIIQFTMGSDAIILDDDHYLALYENDELTWWVAHGQLLEG